MTLYSKNLPLVSVMVVTYNQEAFIKEALVSVLEQSYESLQVVIADDASTDSTQSIILDVIKDYPQRNVELILNKENLGITGNCNQALQRCKGELIAFLGGDDIFSPEKISRQVIWFNDNPDAVLCGHEVELIDEHGRYVSSRFCKLGAFPAGLGAGRIIRFGAPFSALSVMVRRSRIPDYGFHPWIPMVSDWKLWIDVIACDGRFGYVEGKWAKYRRHSENVTAKMNWKIFSDILMTALLSLWHFRGRYAADWFYYFFRRIQNKPQ